MSDHRVIGFFAHFPGGEVICDACIIAGSETKMRDCVSRMSLKGGPTIRKTRFGEIRKGIGLGAAYCFDEEAYSRFQPGTVCHRKIFFMKKTPRAGGASGEPHEAGKTQMSPHPGHEILTDTVRKAGCRRANRKVRGGGETAFPHRRSGRPA